MKVNAIDYIGKEIDVLKKWINEHGNKICLIPNSRDVYPESERKSNGIKADVEELTNLGFDVTIISLVLSPLSSSLNVLNTLETLIPSSKEISVISKKLETIAYPEEKFKKERSQISLFEE